MPIVHARQSRHMTNASSSSRLDDLHSTLQLRLDELQKTTSEPGWDGEGSLAIAEATFRIARAFIRHIETNDVSLPDVGGSENGEITFSWDSGDRRDICDVAIQPDNQITVASMFRGLKLHGYVNDTDEDMSRLIDVLKWFRSESNS